MIKQWTHLVEFLPTLALGRPVRGTEDVYHPIFIIGSGRSGTTLVRSVLCAHPDIHIPPETHVLRSVIKEYQRYSRLPWNVLLRIILGKFEFSKNFALFDISLRELYNYLLNIEPKHQTLAFVLDKFYLYHAAQFKPTASRWGDKTPLNTFGLDSIRTVFPDAYFVHIVRDGRDVVTSYLEMKRYQTIEEAADRWLKSINAARQFGWRYPDSFMQIRYEELVQDTEETTQRLCQFVGIDYRTSMITPYREGFKGMKDLDHLSHLENVKRPISAESIGRWKERIGGADALTLKTLLGPSLQSLGYRL